MSLRVILDESDPLSKAELQERGNEPLRIARAAAIDALRASMRPDFFKAGSYSIVAVRLMHREVKETIAQWSKVEAALAELLNEFEKTRSSAQ